MPFWGKMLLFETPRMYSFEAKRKQKIGSKCKTKYNTKQLSQIPIFLFRAPPPIYNCEFSKKINVFKILNFVFLMECAL